MKNPLLGVLIGSAVNMNSYIYVNVRRTLVLTIQNSAINNLPKPLPCTYFYNYEDLILLDLSLGWENIVKYV